MNIDATLSVYQKADKRFQAGTATKADEVLLALWDENKAKAKHVRELTAENDMFRQREGNSGASSPDYSKMMSKVMLSNMMTQQL